MVYTGIQAIHNLIDNLEDDDSESSSHWKKYHKEFKVNTDLEISGIMGFGGLTKEYRGISKWSHKLFQNKFRKMGQKYQDFDSIDFMAQTMTHIQDRAYDLDVLRQAITLSFLKDKLSNLGWKRNENTVAVIGDGFCSMSLLLLLSQFAKKVILVNLTKTLLVDLIFLQKYNNKNDSVSYALINDNHSYHDLNTLDIIGFQASRHKLLQIFPIDLFINIASMQEMNPDIIAGYFEDMRFVASNRDTYFYCCNRIEKILPDNTKSKFFEYPWSSNDKVFVDELCPWHQEYYTILPPSYRSYNGPHQHRLIKISGKY